MIRFFAQHPTAANLLMIALAAIGLFTLRDIRRETMPDFAAAEVEVQVLYPGAAAEDVEEAVCARIEDAVDGIDGIEEVRSEAREGLGRVVLRVQEGRDVSSILAEVKREVDTITDLPELAEEPLVSELGFLDLVVSIAVAGEGIDPRDLKAYCEELKDRLRLETGIRLVSVRGFSKHQLRVELSSEALERYGLSAQEVADLIGSQSVDLPAGTLTANERELLLRFTDERRTPRDLAELVIVSSAEGGEVLLGDMATIRHAFELDEQKILLDGRRAGLLEIQKTKSEDVLNVFADVADFVEREQARKPPGVELTLTQDVASVVEDRLLMLVKNGWQGMLLVFLALTLFFSPRFSFWVAMGIPVSFLGALFWMQQVDLTINMITMVGLLLALGLLMDDAIVLAENIAAHRQHGKRPLESAIDGVHEVGAGVLSSFATTCMIFGPLAFIQGDIGKVMRVMPMVLILVLAVSLVEAFLILPNHLAHALDHPSADRQGGPRRAVERAMDWARERLLGRTVDWVVRWRYLSIGLILFGLLASAGLVAGGAIKFEAFPNVDGDVIEARVLLPQGTPLSRTEDMTRQLSEALGQIDEEYRPRQPEGQALVQSVTVIFNQNVDAFESGPHVATVVGDLLTAELRDAPIDEVLARWRELAGDVPGTLSIKFTEPTYGPAGRPIEIRLSGYDLETLQAASFELQQWLSGFDGVLDLADDLRPGKPELRMRLREGASGLGLSAQAVASQVRAAFYGSTAQEIQVGSEAYDVDVRLAADERSRITDLDRLQITLPDGAKVPLPAVAHVDEGRGFARIARIDGRRTVTLTGDLDTEQLKSTELIRTLEQAFLPEFLERFPDVTVSIEGESAETATTMDSIQRALSIGLLGVFLLLSFQFRSYAEPFLVLLAIPLCLIGVIWGHWVMGFDMTMMSTLGFGSLAGVVVNDSILLVEFTKHGRRAGLSAGEAAARASRARFRAVLLTSITTVLGLLPLLFEASLQAQFLRPLVASIVFGMLSSTVLILIALPAFYAVLDDFGLSTSSGESTGRA